MKRSENAAYMVLGGVTALLVAAGCFFLAISLASAFPISELNDAEAPFVSRFFVVYSLANVAFLSMLGLATFRLFKRQYSGVRFLSWTLTVELIYWISISLLWIELPARWAMSAGAATGIGNMGLSPQLLIAYPVTGLLSVWILRFFGMLHDDLD